jgi:alkylated DNA repair dioxygenase AlkB
MSDNEVSQMSISALKTVLFQNHVNARLMLEKSDLVARVNALLGDERQERAREAAIHAREEEEIIARQHEMMEEQRRRDQQAHWHEEPRSGARAPEDDAQRHKPNVPPPPMMGTAADLERNGLCVVCQDEEANIAIVDCGCVSISFEGCPLTTKLFP